jgi:hypothetical protein
MVRRLVARAHVATTAPTVSDLAIALVSFVVSRWCSPLFLLFPVSP